MSTPPHVVFRRRQSAVTGPGPEKKIEFASAADHLLQWREDMHGGSIYLFYGLLIYMDC